MAQAAAHAFHNRRKEKLVHVWYFGAKDKEMDVMLLHDDGAGTGLKQLQTWVGGLIEVQPLYVKGSLRYDVVMNENGLNLNLPENENFGKFLPSFPELVGNVVVMATNVNNGRPADLTIKPKNFRKKAKQYIASRY